MFIFYSTEQSEDNERFHKGVLFEQLLRTYLEKGGYTIDVTRRKENSLEYDLHGEHTVDGRRVIGEAKAHSDTIAAPLLTSFVGKSLPFLHGEKPYAALFLATSPISPEAEDYLRNLRQTTQYQVVSMCGLELELQIRKVLDLPTEPDVLRITKPLMPRATAQHLLHTNRGTYILALGSQKEAVFDDRFLVISRDGIPVSDIKFLDALAINLPTLQGLESVLPNSINADRAPTDIGNQREIPYGLITATDWLDFRRPAGKGYFVGRQVEQLRLQALLDPSVKTHGAVIEVKSRSGVGKSSLLAVVAENWRDQGARVELHDARDVKSVTDVLALVRRLTKSGRQIQNLEDVAPALASLGEEGLPSLNIFMVDQFEATFQAPDVFHAYEHIALCVAAGNPHAAFVFARKDDLLTTHDEIVVNLERLRSLANSVNLQDFSREEALALLRAIASSQSRHLTTTILGQVLEFAHGFPWLIKRTMAHVATKLSAGLSQAELLSGGLHLEDLFEEEIGELDEHERGYLTRLAAILPATYHSIVRRFEDDPFLPDMLEKLTHRRLLRFSAGTYDTYNDVFKDYLLYERLPERAQAQVIRLGLVATMRCFRELGGTTEFEAEDLSKRLGKPMGSTYNLLRELRLVGLVAREGGMWKVPEVARQYEHQGRLGEYVRQSILKNRVVSEFLVKLEKEGPVAREIVPLWLREYFPFVEAKSAVWSNYGNLLVDWLRRLKFCRVSSDDVLTIEKQDRDSVLRDLGNLDLSGRGHRRADLPFLPNIPYSTAIRVLQSALTRTLSLRKLTRSEEVARIDLLRLGALREAKNGLWEARWTVDRFSEESRRLLSATPYTCFWKSLSEGTEWGDAANGAFELGSLAPSTRLHLGKKLANWGRNLGLLSMQRLVFQKSKPRASSQRSPKRG
ncbi:MAG: restriction endonuclease [Acidobacteriota bacterium]